MLWLRKEIIMWFIVFIEGINIFFSMFWLFVYIVFGNLSEWINILVKLLNIILILLVYF